MRRTEARQQVVGRLGRPVSWAEWAEACGTSVVELKVCACFILCYCCENYSTTALPSIRIADVSISQTASIFTVHTAHAVFVGVGVSVDVCRCGG